MLRPLLLLLSVSTPCLTAQEDAAKPPRREVPFTVKADDGVELRAQLSVPANGDGPFPVVFFLHGAGPRVCDNPFRYRDEDGQIQVQNYLDFHADELARRGVAFCRMDKRGCDLDPDTGLLRVDREVFLEVTPSRLLKDYQSVFEALRERQEIDPERVVFWGESEGTWMAPRLARLCDADLAGIIMCGYAADNVRETVRWQFTHGSWRGICLLFEAASDGELTEEEYQAAVAKQPGLAAALPFPQMDTNQDKVFTEAEMVALREPLVQAMEHAVANGNDELLLQVLGQHVLASTYLSEWWDGEPNVEVLLELDCPLRIFHGDLDANCRVEGVHEAASVFEEAGKANLAIKVYPRTDHGLNWSRETAQSGGPEGFRDAFAEVVELVKSSK